MKISCACRPSDLGPVNGRRAVLKTLMGVAGVGAAGSFGWLASGEVSYAAALTREQRDSMTPDQVIEQLKLGNERFRTGKMQAHDYLAQKRASAGGQYPAAAILSCIDSRAPG